MLILTRRSEESVLIGDQIQVVVLGVKGNQVRIGIKAPQELVILRHELLQYVSASFGSRFESQFDRRSDRVARTSSTE
jgi:carbon storage regulator